MRKVFLTCLLALGMAATTKAQCPINEILTTRDIQNVANMIDNNTDCIKQLLTQDEEYAGVKGYLDYLYNSTKVWIYHTNPEKEKLFSDFYKKWEKQYPTLTSAAAITDEYKADMAALIATDPEYFKQNKVSAVPQKYKEWLYVQDLKKRYGESKVIALSVAASKIANLPTPSYVYAGNY